jgi:AcrR family transcriptional regulator
MLVWIVTTSRLVHSTTSGQFDARVDTGGLVTDLPVEWGAPASRPVLSINRLAHHTPKAALDVNNVLVARLMTMAELTTAAIDGPDGTEGLRERTRRAVRGELMSIGLTLFAEHGYEHTTIEQIACASGVSKRSFFRYFGSKEDIVLGNFEAVGRRLARALAERPDDEAPWLALRRTFDYLVTLNESDRARSATLMRMLRETPSLQAGRLEKQSRWRELLVPVLLGHLGPADRVQTAIDAQVALRATALVGAALGCVDAAMDEWFASGAQAALGTLIDQAMAAVAPF